MFCRQLMAFEANCIVESRPYQRILEGIRTVDDCRDACHSDDGCLFYNFLLEEKECDLFESPSKACSSLLGVPDRQLEKCE